MKNHRSFFLSFLLIFSYSFVSGQSISQITNSGAPSTLASAFSVGSLWFGAQVSYFNGQSKEFTDNTTTS
ncbi:MAG TPA: hypothetical protein PLD02_14260, partial [Saprospiraceae bacterium]|nr:hypothetical protein [Saprospiraceae bacterium]